MTRTTTSAAATARTNPPADWQSVRKRVSPHEDGAGRGAGVMILRRERLDARLLLGKPGFSWRLRNQEARLPKQKPGFKSHSNVTCPSRSWAFLRRSSGSAA